MPTYSSLNHALRLFSLLAMLTVNTATVAESFPLRAKFPEVPPISTAALQAEYDNYTIIDARSSFEFNTIRIAKAINIPVASKSFEKMLTQKVDKATPISFYCNGTTCAKSYKAARKALKMGYSKATVYDDGIFTWTTTYPEQAALLGTTPANPDKIIPKSALKAHMVDFEQFKLHAAKGNSILIDIRDPYQRTLASDRSKKVDLPPIDGIRSRNIPLDRIEKLLKSDQMKDKTLLIYDMVGKQVRWLQYHLEGNGYSNYYFLNKGVYGVTGIVNK